MCRTGLPNRTVWRATGKRVLQRIVQRRWVRVAFVYRMAAYTLTLPKITAAQAQEGNFLIAKGEGENFRDKKMKFLISARLDLRITL